MGDAKLDPNKFGLWIKTDKNGNKYMSGQWNGFWVNIFKNTLKDNEKQPDYRCIMNPKDSKPTEEAKAVVEDDLPF